ncbi:MAG TPA: DinB family protein [Anaerolineales bacterium]|nr:DinB family protein [Anaerolineales bacterium]HNN12083.1 DinB family protein [Anaerolineales bacterium]HNO31612.1 DinB family protein [Anaerolineales bacterium]
MKELLEYREKLLARLEEAAREFCTECLAFNDPYTKLDGDWNVHQIAAHVSDVSQYVYGARIRRTLAEENPTFANFDGEAWMIENYKSGESLEKILEIFSAEVSRVCILLKEMPEESWSRLSRHETLGGELTLQLWAERGLAHIEEHLLTLKNARNK